MSERTPFVWTHLDLPSPITVDTARAALTALVSVSGQPRIVLEVTGRDGVVSWKLGCEARVRTRVLMALSAQLPGLDSELAVTTLDGLRADTVGAVRLRRTPGSVLDSGGIESSVRGLYGVLASTQTAELLHLQLVIGPRRSPQKPTSGSSRRIREVAALREPRFACQIRIAASTADGARSHSLIGSMAAALRHLEAPGTRIRLTSASTRAFSEVWSPWIWSTELSISEAVALTGWPIAASKSPDLPGLRSQHPRLLRPDNQPTTGRVFGVATADHSRRVALSVEDSLRHLHVLGPTGVGKSTLLARMALDDAAAGRSVVVVDPKGDLIDDILARLDESRLDDVVVLDARDPAPVGINGLANPRDPDLTADVLLGVFHSLYADAWGPRTHDVLHASLLTLARRGDASLAMIPLLLTNPGFRRSVVGQVARSDPMGLGGFWAQWEALSDAERQQATAPLLRRLRPFLLRPGLRGVLGQRRPKFDLSEVFTKRRILLVSLAKGSIGPEAAALLGSLVVAQLWSTALARVTVDPARRHPVMVYIDEVQDYLRLPGDLGDALAQARGLGVGYTLAHQHLGQLPRALREAIAANARSGVAFQLPAGDARDLAARTRGVLEPIDFESLPAFHAYAQLLDHGSPGDWVSLRTEPLGPVLRSPESVRERSRAQYGQPLDEIEADLASLTQPDRNSAAERIGRVRRDRDGSAI